MKKFTIIVLSLIFSYDFSGLYAQAIMGDPSEDWVAMMKDSKVNIHDVQKAFHKWYDKKEHDSDRAIGEEEKDDESYELFKRWEWYNLPRADAEGNRADLNKIGDEYADYLKHSEAHSPHAPVHPTLSIANWGYIGNTTVPTNSPDGSGFGGNGRVNRVRTMPGNDNIIFACTASGGLWKTTNQGISWSSNTDQLGDLTTSDIAINPLKTNVMYLATGDGDGILSIYPDPSTIGILKSYDGGNTWQTTSFSYTLSTSGADYYSVNEIIIDPNDTAVILAATTFGIWRSANSGATWTQTQTGWFHSIEFEPSHPSNVYAASETEFAYGGFFRSTNNGASFTQITSGLPSSSDIERLQLAVSAADSNAVYVLADNPSTYDYQGLYLSTNDGASFTKQSGGSVPNILGRADNGNDYGVGQGWYDLALGVSQTNIDSVWVGGINIWFSSNKGVNWTLNADWFNQDAPYVHADIHHILPLQGTNSKGYLVGCDGGVFMTSNSGTNWSNLSSNLANSEQYCVGAAATTPSLVITGWQDNGTNVSSSPWGQVFGGDGTDCFIDWSNPAIMYAETPGAPTFMRSNNSGTSWSNIVSGITESGEWVTPWLQDPKTNTTLYCGINNVWKSTNSGTSWSKIGTWGGSGIISALAVDSANPSYIYAAQSGLMEVTANGGTSWTSITSGISGSISGIAVSAKTPSHVWVCVSGYNSADKVFASTNSGSTWTNISSGLPNLPVNCIVSESGSPNGIFVGTDQGVYYHDTVTNSWQFYNTNLPLVMIANLKIWQPTIKPSAYFKASPLSVCAGSSVQFTDTSHNSPGATLIAATYGRGTWETQISSEVLSWNWTFTGGNPSTSTSQNPLVVYSTPGTYPVTLVVTNAVGASTLTKSGYITVNANPAVTASVTANVSCNGGSNGSLSASPSGGASPYTYLWSAGGTSSTQTGLSQGTYTITVTDNNGCSGTGSVTITQPLALTTTANVIANVNCNGGSTGNAAANPNNGTAPYTYTWSNGTSTVSTSNPTGATLSAGNYTVTVQDICGESQTAAVTITQPIALATTATVTANVNCNGGSTGNAIASPSGGNSPYTYSWSNGTSTVSTSNPTGATLSAGGYTVTVKDNCGATQTAEVTITQPIALATTATVTANVGCNGGSTGNAIASPSGGNSPYTYSWSNGTSTVSTSNPTGATLSAGGYTVTVKDNCGASQTAAVTITEPLALSTTASIVANVSCRGGSSGNASASPSNGNTPYTYSWVNSSSTVVSTSNPTGAVLPAGGYTVAVKDNCGAAQTAAVTITQPLALNTTAMVVSDVNCNSSGNASATPTGGTAPYTYSWSNGTSTVSASNPSGPVLNVGNYTVTVTDNCLATATASVTITQSNALVVNWWESLPVSCFGGSNGVAVTNVYGGTPPYTYLWSNGNTAGESTTMSAGTYTVTVTDANGCTGSNSISISQPATSVTETIMLNSNLTCHELPPLNNPDGSATSNPSGGVPPYVYSWIPSGGTSQTSVTLEAGTDYCKVTDAHGCSTTASVVLTQPTVIFAVFTSKTIPSCNGDTNGTVTAAGTGGSGIYTNYVWSPYGGTTATATGLSAQTYTITITDNTGCLGTAPVVMPQPAVLAVSIPSYTCVVGGKAEIEAVATGGTPSYIYSWSNGSSSVVGTKALETFADGSYTVAVTDQHSCPKVTASINFHSCPEIEGVVKGGDNGGGKNNDTPEITVYPNPTTGQFTIQINNGQLTIDDKTTNIEIYNMLGEKVYSKLSIVNYPMLINLSNQANGIYLIRILDSSGTLVTSSKVVKIY